MKKPKRGDFSLATFVKETTAKVEVMTEQHLYNNWEIPRFARDDSESFGRKGEGRGSRCEPLPSPPYLLNNSVIPNPAEAG